MAGWLGSNFTSQLDSLRNQVSSIAKEVFVEDAEKEKDELEILRENCRKLELLRQEAVAEKEEQCNNFRQLLMEKEQEIEQLSQMVEESQNTCDSGTADQSGSIERIRLEAENKKLCARLSQLEAQHDSAAQDRLETELLETKFQQELEASEVKYEGMVAKYEADLEAMEFKFVNRQQELLEITRQQEVKMQEQEREWREQEDRLKDQLLELRTRVKDMAVEHQIQLTAREEAWQEEKRALLEQMQAQADDHHVSLESADHHKIAQDEAWTDYNSLSKKNKALEQKEKELLAVVQELEDDRNAKSSQLSNLQTLVEDLQVKLKETEAQYQLVSTEYHTSGAKISDLSAKCDEIQTDHQQYKVKYEELEAKCLNKDMELLAKCQECDALETAVQAAEAKRKNLEDECQGWEQKMKIAYENKEREAGQREAEKAALVEQLEEATRRCAKYEKEAADNSATRDPGSNREDLKEMIAENKMLKEKVFSLSQEASIRQNTERKLEQENAHLHSENESLRSETCSLLSSSEYATMVDSPVASNGHADVTESASDAVKCIPDDTVRTGVTEREELVRMRGELEELGKQKEKMKDILEIRETENANLVQQLEKFKLKLSEKYEATGDLDNISRQFNAQLERSQIETEQLRHQLERSQIETEQLRHQLERSQIEITELRRQLEEQMKLSQREVLELRQMLEEQLESSRREKIEMGCRLEAANAGAEKKLCEAETNLSHIKAQLFEMESKLAMAEANLSAETSEIEELRCRLAEAELLAKESKELSDKVKSYEKQMSQLSSQLATTKQQLAEGAAVIGDLHQELADSRAENDAKEQAIEALKAAWAQKEEEMNTELSIQQSKAQVIEAELEARTLAFANLAMEADSLRSQLERNDEAARDIADAELRSQIRELAAREQEALNELAVLRAAAEAEKASLQSQLAQAFEDLKRVQSLLVKAHDSDKEVARLSPLLDSLTRENQELAMTLAESRKELEAATSRHAELEAQTGRLAELDVMAGRLVELEASRADSATSESEVKHLIQVVNERTRELQQARSEYSHLMQQLTEERERREQLELSASDLRESYSQMSGETVQRLSSLVRDRDLEVESLNQRIKSLLEVLQNEKNGSNIEDLEKRCSVLEAENSSLQERLKLASSSNSLTTKDSVQHTNELLYLKGRIAELEKKLSHVGVDFEVKVTTTKLLTAAEDNSRDAAAIVNDLGVAADSSQVKWLNQRNKELETKVSELSQQVATEQCKVIQLEKAELMRRGESTETAKLHQEVESLREESERFREEAERLREIVERSSREADRLREEKGGEEERLRRREDEVRDLHREVKSLIEKKKWVEGEVDRLRAHLVEVEEAYTQELMAGDDREQELRKRVARLEDQVRKATVTHSEASQEASEATSHLTEALTAAAAARDSATTQLAAANAKLREKTTALRNLQLALEGFQRQRDNEIRQVERRCQDQMDREKRKVKEAEEQLAALKQQLERAGEGLEAAARLSQQLDNKQQVIASLRHELTAREELLKGAQQQLQSATSAQVGRVDRDLVKNLLLGYVTADNNKKLEILRIVATVLDFNKEERARTGLDTDGGGWLGGFIRGRRDSGYHRRTAQINESIAQAFVKFLEEESTPHTPVVLPVLEMARIKQDQVAGRSPGSPSPSPLLLSTLPSLSPSPNILKAVLDEERH